MLSIWKLRVGAENYYLSKVASGLEDYYSGRGEQPGRWLGAASSGLGLGVEPVDPDELRAVLAGLAPGAGESPNGGPPRVWKNRIPGFDLTFAVPKSVSVLYALGDPLVAGDVTAAVDAATEAAVGWLEREACFVRRGSNSRPSPGAGSGEFGTRRLRGAGFVAAGFGHRTSRAGDPHLHTHVLVANLSRGPDGRWTALDAQGLYRCRRTAGSVFQTALRHQLTERLGVDWRPTSRGLAEVAGIPDAVIRLFSKRRADIEAHLAAEGVDGFAAAGEAMLATRPTKPDLEDVGLLRDRWLAEAATVGFSPEHLDRLLSAPAAALPDGRLVARVADPVTGELADVEVASERFAGWVADQMTETDSSCTRHQVTEIVARALPAGVSVNGLERVTNLVLSSEYLVSVPPSTRSVGRPAGWEQRWTSRHQLHVETDILDALDAPADRPGLDDTAVEATLTRFPTLGADQADAVRRLAGSGRPVEVIVGRAGTGKTFTLAALRTVLEAAGFRVVGVAPSARAARELADTAGIDAYTFPRFQLHVTGGLCRSDVVVVDEAGMAATSDMHRVMTAARRVGARVILVGDHHQLPEINAGGVFAAAVDRRHGDVAELVVNRRQQARWEHAALDQLRHGRPLEGLQTYQDHGHVHVAASSREVHAEAVDGWFHAHAEGADGILLAGTVAEARRLNQLARARVANELTGPAHHLGGRSFQVGDRVVLLRNQAESFGHLDLATGRTCRVDNGMVATITRIHPDGRVDIDLKGGRRIRLTAAYLAGGFVDHGYATTIHKAQGVTCDRVFLVGPAGLYREAVYVAMSRARQASHIYATTRQLSELTERPHSTGLPLPDEHPDELDRDLRHAVSTSRAKRLALADEPHLVRIAELSVERDLGQLVARRVELKAATATLRREGFVEPTIARARLARAWEHRRFLTVGVRVNAADWDNLGTVLAVDDHRGRCHVEFVSADRRRRSRRWLHWADTRPVDHPDPVELTAAATAHFDRAEHALAPTEEVWARQLRDRFNADPDELHVITAAIELRRQRLTHRLAGNPPDWAAWWYGTRPADPIGAQVWDDEIGRLAAWRDTHQLDDHTPGYGPPPNNPDHARSWAEHMDRSLRVATWLHHHQPKLPAPTIKPVDIVAVRRRLAELDTLLASAPPDQQRIIADLTAGHLHAPGLHRALLDAIDTQHARRNWILEHWPHVVEHTELTRISHHHPPLAHWPPPVPAHVQQLLEQIEAHSVDSPELRTLTELDRAAAEHNPWAIRDRLHRQRNDLTAKRRHLETQLSHADDVHAAVVRHHLTRIHQRLADLHVELAGHGARVALWISGSRPGDLAHATRRRANHLAHQAITNHDPWVTDLIATRTQQQPATSAKSLHATIVDVAAYRERVGHTGPDPLGAPPPLGDPQRPVWQQLHHHIHTHRAHTVAG